MGDNSIINFCEKCLISWSNGITEKHKMILRNMKSKVLLDKSNKHPIEIIVAWPSVPKNALHNCYGYSPSQIVFGKNPNFPLVLIDNQLVLEGQHPVKQFSIIWMRCMQFEQPLSNWKTAKTLGEQ